MDFGPGEQFRIPFLDLRIQFGFRPWRTILLELCSLNGNKKCSEKSSTKSLKELKESSPDHGLHGNGPLFVELLPPDDDYDEQQEQKMTMIICSEILKRSNH